MLVIWIPVFTGMTNSCKLGRFFGGLRSFLGIDIKRLCVAVHNLGINDHFFNALKGRLVKHGVEQDLLKD